MNSRNISNEEQTKQKNTKVGFENIKSNVILLKIFNCLKKYKQFKIMQYNKKL